MAEYIEREALVRQIICNMAEFVGAPDEVQRHDEYCNYAINIIEDAPAADIAEVRHGRWVDRIVDENEVIQPWMERYYCSECLEGGNQSWFNFCPNCGVKMDLEE